MTERSAVTTSRTCLWMALNRYMKASMYRTREAGTGFEHPFDVMRKMVQQAFRSGHAFRRGLPGWSILREGMVGAEDRQHRWKDRRGAHRSSRSAIGIPNSFANAAAREALRLAMATIRRMAQRRAKEWPCYSSSTEDPDSYHFRSADPIRLHLPRSLQDRPCRSSRAWRARINRSVMRTR